MKAAVAEPLVRSWHSAAAVFASFAAWGASTVTLPPDLIMPVVATLFLGFAAVLAMFAVATATPIPTRSRMPTLPVP